MDCEYTELQYNAQNWAKKAAEAGWLSPEDIKQILEINSSDPSELFDQTVRRPLVVAFFGGTGVGKSSLLNRLADQAIARTGEQRPTSREISIYIHNSLEIRQMPNNFPIDKSRIAQHDNSKIKHIMWIDMPDIDSTESANREIVLQWLPHVDILLYVVSPERYKDQRGWNLLLDLGSRHAWIFIMNQKDKSAAGQIDAFKSQLSRAGFDDPIVLETDCRSDEEPRIADDFNKLKQIIHELSESHFIEQFELNSLNARYKDLRTAINLCIDRLGTQQSTDLILQQWHTIWLETASSLEAGMQWPIQQIARSYAVRPNSILSKFIKTSSANTETDTQTNDKITLWDPWAQTRIDDAIDQIIVAAGINNIQTSPFKTGLDEHRKQAENIMHSQVEQILRQSLAKPGGSMRRFFIKLGGIAMIVLPLMAIGWVAYELFDQFYKSSNSGEPYLGVDFAIHSGLLILVSWLFPWFTNQKLRPSMEKVAHNALNRGVILGFELIQSNVNQSLLKILEQREQYLLEGQSFSAACNLESISRTDTDISLLNRTLVNYRSNIQPPDS